MISTDKYKMFKQFMHNELNISKDDIRTWIQESIQEEVRKLVDRSYGEFSIEKCIENHITKNMNYYTIDRKQLTEEIKTTIGKLLIEKLNIKLEIGRIL